MLPFRCSRSKQRRWLRSGLVTPLSGHTKSDLNSRCHVDTSAHYVRPAATNYQPIHRNQVSSMTFDYAISIDKNMRLTVEVIQDMGTAVCYLTSLTLRQQSRIHTDNPTTNISNTNSIPPQTAPNPYGYGANTHVQKRQNARPKKPPGTAQQ